MRRMLLGSLLLIILAGCRRPEYPSGEAVFQGECVKCHKLNGKGGTKGPDLTTLFSKKDEDLVRTIIQDPRSVKPDGTMPPAKLSDKELDMVVQYLKQQNSPSAKKP